LTVQNIATRVLLDRCLYVNIRSRLSLFNLASAGRLWVDYHPDWSLHRMDCSYTGCHWGCKVVQFQIPWAVIILCGIWSI